MVDFVRSWMNMPKWSLVESLWYPMLLGSTTISAKRKSGLEIEQSFKHQCVNYQSLLNDYKTSYHGSKILNCDQSNLFQEVERINTGENQYWKESRFASIVFRPSCFGLENFYFFPWQDKQDCHPWSIRFLWDRSHETTLPIVLSWVFFGQC